MRMQKLILTFIAVFSCAQSTNAFEYSTSFDQAAEFPSYFSQGSAAEQAAIKAEVENILRLRFNNMTIPVPAQESGSYQRVRFVDWATQEAKKLGLAERVQFFPSGGLVRNNISSIYEQVYQEKKTAPNRPIVEILREIRSKVPNEVFHTQIRGVGSDFDVLIGGLNSDELHRFNSTLENQITAFEKKAGLMSANKQGAGALKKSFIVIPDFKDVTKQITRATGQGGLEGDFLFFDMKEGRLKDPSQLGNAAMTDSPHLAKYAGAGDRFLSGNLKYHPPYDEAVVRLGETDSQTVRALRTLSEAPWTSVDDLSGTWASELKEVIQKGNLSPKAQEQLTKMVRNSRFGGGSNRFDRASANELDKLIADLKKAYPNQFRTFVAQSSKAEMSEKFKSAPKGLQEAVLGADRLPRALYHGVPSVDALPSIARNGLILSTTNVNDSTTAVYGDGAYASEKYSVAKGYERGSGVVIPVELDKDARVVDWSKVPQETRTLLETEAKKRGIPVNILLHDQYGVQAVKNNHFMILDMAGVKQPVRNYSDILKFYARNLEQLPATQRSFGDIVSTLQIAKYAQLSGEPGVDEILNKSKVGDGKRINWDRMLAESFGKNPTEDLKSLMAADASSFSDITRKRIIQKLDDPSFKRALAADIWSDPKAIRSKIDAIARAAQSNLGADDSGRISQRQVTNAAQKKLGEILAEGGRLRTEIFKNPYEFLSLTSNQSLAAEIKQPLQKAMVELSKSPSFAKKVAADIEAKISGRNNFALNMANGLPPSLASQVLDSVQYTPERMPSSYGLFKDGKLTPLGEWVLKNDKKGLIKTVEGQMYWLREMDIQTLDKLRKEGLRLDVIAKSGRKIIDAGEVTEFGRWMFKQDATTAKALVEKSYLRNLSVASSDYLHKNGVDMKTILKSQVPVVSEGKLTPFGQWALSADSATVVDDFARNKPHMIRKMDPATQRTLHDYGLPADVIAKSSRQEIVTAGQLTDYGKWLLEKDPSQVTNYFEKYPRSLKDLGVKEIQLLHAKGLSDQSILKSGAAVIKDSQLTDFGKWSLKTFKGKAEANFSSYQIKNLSLEDLDFMSQNGMPREKILAGARGAVTNNGKLTDIAKWSLKNARSEAVSLISPFDIPKVTDSTDMKLIIDSGVSKQSIAKYASEEVLEKAGIKVTSEGNGKRTVHFSETETVSSRFYNPPKVPGSESVQARPENGEVQPQNSPAQTEPKKASSTLSKEETRIPTVVDPVCIEKTLQRLAK